MYMKHENIEPSKRDKENQSKTIKGTKITNKTVVIITHDLEVANKCDRIVELHGGTIIRDDKIKPKQAI